MVSAGPRTLPVRRVAVGSAKLENSFVVPDTALADVPAALWAPAESTRDTAGVGRNGAGPRGLS
jgi:hypothetical protein